MEKLCRWQVKQPFNTGSSWVRKPRFKANRSVTNPQKFMWWLWPQSWCQHPAWVPGCCTSSFSGKLNTVRSPSMVSEKNTAFCPVTAHGSSPLFEGKMELWDPSQTYGQTSSICMVLRLDPPNIPSRMHLTSFNLYLFFCLWHICTWVGDRHTHRPTEGLAILPYHSSLYSLQTGSHIEPGARQMASNPLSFLSPHTP